ncbi:MAG: RING finger protein [Candidatus Woesearchaeota archaeon]
MEKLPAEAAKCPVCGTSMKRKRKVCPRCRTPHHRDCWRYNKGCAIFGCGSSSKIEVAPKPALTESEHHEPTLPVMILQSCAFITLFVPSVVVVCGILLGAFCGLCLSIGLLAQEFSKLF